MAETGVTPKKAGDENIIAAVSYLLGFFTGIPIYLMYKEKSKFVSFHAVQSTILFGGIFILDMILMITLVGILLIPFVGLGSLVLWIWLMYKAYQGEKYKLPKIGNMAEKYAG
jgi:uncharacterized membrane protein